MNELPHERGGVKPRAASYRTPVSPLYRGNPLIEALPSLPPDEELWDKLAFHPPYSPDDRNAPARDRQEMLECLKFFFQPLPRHLTLAQGIFKMARVGYASRNPSWGKALKFPVEGALESAALLGSSGIGKTQSVRHVLQVLGDQVVHHTCYDGRTVDETQVVWLRAECPHDASPRGLCISFFQKMDQLLGTTYNKQYGESRPTVNSMIPGLVTVAQEHYLGLLVIDEVQNLFTRQTKVSDELRDFIVRIINDIGIPVLMLGTSRTAALLSNTFRVDRRLTGLQQPYWDRFKEESVEWVMFSDELWRYQYVTNYVEVLSDDLREVLYDLTQGIPDLVVKLFYLAQMHAINEGTEELTESLFRQVTEKALVQNSRYLDDLRNKRIPAGEYQYEPVWKQAVFAVPEEQQAQPAKGKKHKRKDEVSEPPPDAPILNLFGSEPGESTYDALKRQGNVHSAGPAPEPDETQRV